MSGSKLNPWYEAIPPERLRALWVEAGGDIRAAMKLDPAAVELDEEPVSEGLAPTCNDYPPALRDLVAPGVLYVRGTLPRGRRIAVVGSRAVDYEGARLAKRLVADLSRAGITIVSGGAIGVDTIAHSVALQMGAPTVAFLPSAFDRPTPARNRRLFERIEKHGALASEYPPGVAARRYHFYRRNRLIAAFADAVLVIRAATKSGTLLTARAAMELGRPLFVVPGSPEDETSRGCIELLREGARCVSDASQLLEDVGWAGIERTTPRNEVPAHITIGANRVYQVVGTSYANTEQLCRMTEMTAGEVAAALLELELCGLVEKLPGASRWRRP